MTAQVHVLTAGYADDRVASTVSLIVDGDAVIVVDPGMVADRGRILDPLRLLGVDPATVTDVIFSHHHPDHTLNAALFLNARYHDHWAIYKDDDWDSRGADGFGVAGSVRLLATPGHTPEDISTVVDSDQGLVVMTHAWWHAEGPEVDPYALDMAQLHASREKILALRPSLIIPGHGEPFAPDQSTPR